MCEPGLQVTLDTLYFCTVLRRAQGESVPFAGFFCLAGTADYNGTGRTSLMPEDGD
jgi:hypothetical protein